MIGSLTKCIAEFLRSTEVVKNNNIPVYTANTVEGRFTVNTSLPAILITVAPSENPTVFISGNILDSINIHIRYMDDLLNYTMSEDDGIYEDRRDWAYQLRDELWNNKQSTYFKQFMNVNGLNIMYKGMSTYTQVGVLENLSKDIDVFSFIFSCNLFSNRLSSFPTVPLQEFFITLQGAHGERPDPGLVTVTASGEKFPVWNTIQGSDKIKSLSIHGKSYQNGEATPLSPIEIQSVGDNTITLQTGDSENIVSLEIDIRKSLTDALSDGILRSVNGIYDEVVYNGKEWKLIQRIGVLDNIPEMGTLFKDATYTDKQLFRFQFNKSEPKNFCASGQILSNIFITATSPAMHKQPLNSCWSQYSRENVHYIYFNVPLEYDTVEKAISYLGENYEICYPLYKPMEYAIDLPVIPTYDNQTWISTVKDDVNPRIVTECEVTEIFDYIKDGLIGYYTGRGRSNTDENKNILPDLSGNGNDLENKNFAYTVDSGYGDGYIQYDGVDDFSSVEKAMTNIDFTILFTISDVELLTGNSWSGLIYGSSYYLGINKGICFSSENRYIMNGNISKTNFNISNKGKEIFVVGCFNGGKENNVIGITLGSINNSPIYACKQKIYDVLIYNRELTEEEIKHNYKVSLQYNGMTL